MLIRAGAMALLIVLFAGVAEAADVNVRALGDFVVAGDEDLADLNRLRTGDSYVDLVHGRLFFDAGTDRTAFFAQIVLSDAANDAVRIYGAYLQHQLFEQRQHFVQLGKIPTPQGTWGPRTYADKNPLVAVPFAYFWQTSLPVSGVPADLDELVGRADGTTTYGALMLYDNCWNEGLSFLGAHGPFSYNLAATRGAPGNPVTGGPENDDIALHARLSYAPIADVQLSFSWGRGAYLNRSAQEDLAPGQSINEYRQNLYMGSLKLARGYFEFNGEFLWNEFETPLRAEGLAAWSAYGDLEWNFAVGWYAAARYDTMRFEEVETQTLGRQTWDTDIQRIEGGIGYNVNRNFILKGVVQLNDVGDGFKGETTLPMVQAVVSF